jgi:hypothetical protein
MPAHAPPRLAEMAASDANAKVRAEAVRALR